MIRTTFRRIANQATNSANNGYQLAYNQLERARGKTCAASQTILFAVIPTLPKHFLVSRTFTSFHSPPSNTRAKAYLEEIRKKDPRLNELATRLAKEVSLILDSNAKNGPKK